MCNWQSIFVYLLNVIDFIVFTFLISCNFSICAVGKICDYNLCVSMRTVIFNSLIQVNSIKWHPFIKTSVNYKMNYLYSSALELNYNPRSVNRNPCPRNSSFSSFIHQVYELPDLNINHNLQALAFVLYVVHTVLVI